MISGGVRSEDNILLSDFDLSRCKFKVPAKVELGSRVSGNSSPPGRRRSSAESGALWIFEYRPWSEMDSFSSGISSTGGFGKGKLMAGE